MTAASNADSNLLKLASNPYPGRGFVVGMDEQGKHLVQVYWIMGRKVSSRNRVFVYGVANEPGLVGVQVANPALLEEGQDLSLIVYNAMREVEVPYRKCAVVSNGVQTDSVISGLVEDKSFVETLGMHEYEPDPPHYTQRITACSRWSPMGGGYSPFLEIAVLRKSPYGDCCERHLHQYGETPLGLGLYTSTYAGDGSPLPPFVGEPPVMPLRGDAEDIAETYWAALNEENRVSLAVKFIPCDGPSRVVIINKYEKVT